jgi:hypothetical protein
MDQDLLPSLTAFRFKCAPNLFDQSRFKSDYETIGLTKEAGLSRVAVWAAVNDVLKLTHSVTPG